MDRAKQKRLEAAGWRVGTVAEFFDLSPAEAVYLEIRIRLSEALKNRRVTRGMSQSILAQMVGSSQSRVAKMENYDPSVTIDLLIKALIATGASVAELSRIVGFDAPKPIVVDEAKTGDATLKLGPIVFPEQQAGNSRYMHVSIP